MEEDNVAAEFPAEDLNGTGIGSGENLPIPKFGEEDLLQVRQVEKIKMTFERRPRRVNVKHVKKCMWELIDNDHKNSSSTSQKENLENSEHSYNFSDLRNELDGILTGDTKDNLTPSMALVCVLYLANERGLELEQSDNLTDFNIKHPEIIKNNF